MKIAVQGLWHLGSVTAACLAKLGHDVVGIDPDAKVVADLSNAKAPLFEPGLDDLLAEGLAAQRLAFSTDPKAVKGSAVVWVTFDTPVDDDDNADVDYVVRQIEGVLPHMDDKSVLLISSQLSAGTATRLEGMLPKGKTIGLAVSPENLRLGKAIDVFMQSERIIVGTQAPWVKDALEPMIAGVCPNILWMSCASAEMVKHALNSFLAVSVTFANEVAVLCERIGADAADVERALKAEPRIGPKAYIRPGSAFAGGTLARDIAFLGQLADQFGTGAAMLKSVPGSNNAHRQWPIKTLEHLWGDLAGRRVAILGLAYKPGTDAVRRSLGVELARGLIAAKARPVAYDPKVSTSPVSGLILASSLADALQGAEAAVVATAWPEFKDLSEGMLLAGMETPLLLDPDRHLGHLASAKSIRYVTIGTPA
ncbi:UDP-glucose 6-dehydrogenase Udg [Rhodospirillaceae bacterium LM-1]|nr:UDP-glucose 6-dehydrogenase Udg [Rhodospirillaceae bacterium LM-1]